MAWGKIIGGAIGAFVGGPVGSVAGVGLGHLLDAFSDEEEEGPFEFPKVVVTHGACAESGPCALVSVDVVGPASLPEDLAVVLRLQEPDDSYLKATDEEYADSDGDFVAAHYLLRRDSANAGRTVIHVPYRSVRRGDSGLLKLRLTVVSSTMGWGNNAQSFIVNDWPCTEEADRENALALWVDMGIGLVRSDGLLEREEVRAIREILVERYGLDEYATTILREYLKRADGMPSTVESLVERALELPIDGDEESLLIFLYLVADADGVVQDSEEAFIQEVCRGIGVADAVRLDVRSRFVRDSTAYFEALEVSPDATFQEVKRAYRRLSVDYHPDKVAQMPHRFRAFAEEQQKSLNEAYTELSKRFASQVAQPQRPSHGVSG